MESSKSGRSCSELETLKTPSSQNPFPPPFRRRPLRSQTFRTLLHILSSHSYDHDPHPLLQASPDHPKQDCGDNALGQVTECNESIVQEQMESKNLLVLQESEENREIVGCRDADFIPTEVEIDVLEHINEMDHDIQVNSMAEGNHANDSIVVGGLTNNQEDHFNDPKLHMEMVGPDQMEFGNLLVLNESEENREAIGSHHTHFKPKQLEIDGLEHINVIDHDINVNSAGIRDQTTDSIVGSINNEEDRSSDLGLHMEESGHKEQLEADKELCDPEWCEAIESCFGIDMIAESTKPAENNEERRPAVERYVLEEVEPELLQKERELEKLISSSGSKNTSFLFITAAEEIEEGQISGDDGVHDESVDFLPEDAASLKEKKVEEVQISNPMIYKQVSTHDEQNTGLGRSTESTSLFVDEIDESSNIMDVELKECIRKEVEDESRMLVCCKLLEAKKADMYGSMLETGKIKKQGAGVEEYDSPSARLTNPPLHDQTSWENHPEIQGIASTAGKDGLLNKKRNRGGRTNESREKRKGKERIRRAKKNRELGVKRLKLPPMLKPKTVAYCRHFIKGRCHEAEKCKFSHDTIPLTKSKPCCHFARHACMKGDDCPFDHQLSKYPCNSFLSKGSCNRGDDCMFSHEIPVKESPVTAPNISEPESSSSILLGNICSKKELNIQGAPRHNVNAKSFVTRISPCKSTEPKVTKPTLKSAAEPPKGIRILSQGKLSLGYIGKKKQGDSSLRRYDAIKVDHQMIHSVADVVQMSNEITKKTPAVSPMGINFLSFGKVPLDNFCSMRPSSSPSVRDYVPGKSLLGYRSKDKQAGSSPMGDDHRASQSASISVVNLNEIARRTPAVAPRGINLVSFGKARVDVSINKKQPHLQSNEDNSVPPSVQAENGLDKLQISNAMLSTSSSFNCGQSSHQLASGRSNSTPGSSQKSLLSNTPISVQKSLQSNTPISVQKSLQSMLAFAAKFESGIKIHQSTGAPAVRTNFDMGAGSS